LNLILSMEARFGIVYAIFIKLVIKAALVNFNEYK